MFIKDLWIVLEDDQEVRIIDSANTIVWYTGPAKTIIGNTFDYLIRRISVNDDKTIDIMV